MRQPMIPSNLSAAMTGAGIHAPAGQHFRLLLLSGDELAARSIRRDHVGHLTCWSLGSEPFDVRLDALAALFAVIDADPTIPRAKR